MPDSHIGWMPLINKIGLWLFSNIIRIFKYQVKKETVCVSVGCTARLLTVLTFSCMCICFKQFHVLWLLCFSVHTCTCMMCSVIHTVSQNTCEGQRATRGNCFSFHPVDPLHQTEVISLSVRVLYSLNHLASSELTFAILCGFPWTPW